MSPRAVGTAIGRPAPGEYADYYTGYVERVPEGDVLDVLARDLDDALALLGGVDEERASHRYAPGKWTLAEVLGHVVDIERVFATRAMLFARGDAQPLPGVEQDDLIAGGDFAARPLFSLLDELAHLRRANIALFASLGEQTHLRRGVASGCEFTVRALVYVLAGHAAHHVDVIRERYLA